MAYGMNERREMEMVVKRQWKEKGENNQFESEMHCLIMDVCRRWTYGEL